MVEYKFEKLYLAKQGKDSNQDVYVEKCPLVQHQLDGIRFLYRALKKKNSGVVLNDPPCYGKRVQTALFISAVLPTLSKPVLVLCKEGYEQLWMKHFQNWTGISNDDIETTNPSSKKRVFIADVSSVMTFARRDWSVVVVDHDVIPKEVVKSTLRAELRIWIISIDIKADLAKFSTFYSWIHPKEMFYADKFEANASDVRDVITKMAMLDAFLEDYVLRRESDVVPFPRSRESIIAEPMTSKKNKDVTGTKIKRSKRTSVKIDTQVPRKVTKVTNNNDTETFEMGDIDISFSNRDITTTSKAKIWDSDIDSDSDVNAKVDETNRKEKSNQLDDKTCDKNTKNDNTTDKGATKRKIRNVIESDSDTDCENGNLKTGVNDTRPNVNNNISPCLPTAGQYPPSHSSINVNKVIKNNSNNHMRKPLANDEMIVDCVDLEIKNDSTQSKNEIFRIVNIPEEGDYDKSEDLFSTDFTTNLKNSNEIDNLISTKPNEFDKEIVYENTEVKEELNADKEKTDQKPPRNESNLSSFDMKMKLLEEQTLKKFKGSFLDTLF